ncbi:MAG: GNAT family N-acetyltransferase [Paracoccus sp. (in: a-proteobacteria)]
MSEITITKEETDPRHGRYVARIEGVDAEGEITFTHRGEGVISADHTGVPDAMGGRGVARALLNFMLEDARASGFRIIPVCPYIRGQYARHPEWSDLFTTKPGEDS